MKRAVKFFVTGATAALLAAAEGMGRDAELIDALRDTDVVARGPKAAGAAATAGLEIWWQTPGERSVEIVDHLRGDAERGARIAVLADHKVVALGTIPELLALDHEWIQEYLKGPRGRAAAHRETEGADA